MYKEKEKNDINDKADKARKQASDDVRSGVYRVAGDAYEAGSDVIEDLQNIAHETGKRFRRFADQAEETTDNMKTKIRDYPIGATAIAVGVGFLIGSLFRGKAN